MMSQLIKETLSRKFDCQGIYAIQHIASERRYIGSANKIKIRLNKHRGELQKNQHHSKYLQNAWNKYGEDEFLAIVVEKVNVRDNLSEREQYWIDYYDSYKNGFNARPTAENFYGMEWSDEQNIARKNSNIQRWKDYSGPQYSDNKLRW